MDGPDSRKARKDLMQVELLASVLAEDRPTDLAEAYDEAINRGAKWKTRIERSLKRFPSIATSIEKATGVR